MFEHLRRTPRRAIIIFMLNSHQQRIFISTVLLGLISVSFSVSAQQGASNEMLAPVLQSQGNSEWQFNSETFARLFITDLYQVSSGGSYIADNGGGLFFSTTNPPNRDYSVIQWTGNLPRWLNNTMIYLDYEHDGYDAPQCLNQNQATFGFYDANTKTNEIHCVGGPIAYTAAEFTFNPLARDPFDDHTILAEKRYLVDLRANSWQDLQGTMPVGVSPANTLSWVGSDDIWWNPQTRRPAARIEDQMQVSGVSEITAETVMLCPIENENCQPLFSVQSHIHGNLADMIVSPDGPTVLWSARVFPNGQPVYMSEAIGSISDLAAFATDVQTGATTQIFLLSAHNTTQAKGVDAQWSEDGLTLAVNMEVLGDDSSPDNGLMLVHFTHNRR